MIDKKTSRPLRIGTRKALSQKRAIENKMGGRDHEGAYTLLAKTSKAG